MHNTQHLMFQSCGHKRILNAWSVSHYYNNQHIIQYLRLWYISYVKQRKLWEPFKMHILAQSLRLSLTQSTYSLAGYVRIGCYYVYEISFTIACTGQIKVTCLFYYSVTLLKMSAISDVWDTSTCHIYFPNILYCFAIILASLIYFFTYTPLVIV